MVRRPRVRLQRKIEKLKADLLTMADAVKNRLEMSIQAIRDRDRELAITIIDGDSEINRSELEIEEGCLAILALHQPVAMDLRLITGVFKIANQLERIGDLAVNIAETAILMAAEKPLEVTSEYFIMAEKTQAMLRKALLAFTKMDEDMAVEILSDDDEIDMMKHKLHSNLEERLTREIDRRRVLIHLFLVSRHLERIADHATNIAEDVVYMVTGELVGYDYNE
ncbi:MAG: phosphate signaling complex protein PhoU [Pseudomonadota bacterium]